MGMLAALQPSFVGSGRCSASNLSQSSSMASRIQNPGPWAPSEMVTKVVPIVSPANDDVGMDAAGVNATTGSPRFAARSYAPVMRLRRRETEVGEGIAPFCGQAGTLAVDPRGGEHQSYIEDCAVCSPRVVHVEPGDGAGDVRAWVERGE